MEPITTKARGGRVNITAPSVEKYDMRTGVIKDDCGCEKNSDLPITKKAKQ